MDLPSGWTAHLDNSGRIFFANHVSQVTTFEDPRPLPAGWVFVKNTGGPDFFANHNMQITQWNVS